MILKPDLFYKRLIAPLLVVLYTSSYYANGFKSAIKVIIMTREGDTGR